MASECTATRGTWLAKSLDLGGGLGALTVFGIAACPTGGHTCSLKPAVPQGFNPRDLLLDLHCRQSGVATDVLSDVPVYYVQFESARQYDTVTINPGGISVKVEPVAVSRT